MSACCQVSLFACLARGNCCATWPWFDGNTQGRLVSFGQAESCSSLLVHLTRTRWENGGRQCLYWLAHVFLCRVTSSQSFVFRFKNKSCVRNHVFEPQTWLNTTPTPNPLPFLQCMLLYYPLWELNLRTSFPISIGLPSKRRSWRNLDTWDLWDR